jgi:hypothetical protein
MQEAIEKHICVNSFAAAVRARGLSHSNPMSTRSAGAYLAMGTLDGYLTEALAGLCVAGMPLRTRSKVVRTHVVEALGYAAPKRFGKGLVFPAQNLDVYVQKANNLQIWNEKIDAKRRYTVVLLDGHDRVAGVRTFTGATLSKWSRTGTLTTKFQATLKLVFDEAVKYHVCGRDTERAIQFVGPVRASGSAAAEPLTGGLLPIENLAEKLSKLIGTKVPFVGAVDEKRRSAALLGAVSKALGYGAAEETSAFPDLPAQMLEVKLQTSPTIDLGRTWPSSDSPLNFQGGRTKMLRRRDVRFAVFYGTRVGNHIRLDKLVVTPGARFWDVFEPLKGNERNTKLQIKLPRAAMTV